MAQKISLNLPYETENQRKLYLEMMQKVKSIPATDDLLSERTNADKLSDLICNIYDVFNKTKEIFNEFCKKEKCDFSAQLEQVTANGQIEETNAAVNDYIKQIFGEHHGFKLPKDVVWKNKKVSIAELLDEVKEQIADYVVQGAEKLGCKVTQKKVQLTYIEKATNQTRISDSSHVDCLIYALYRLNETKAEASIFHKKPIFSGPKIGQKLEVLIDQQGFHLVDTAQYGDFIIYLNAQGNLCHGGIMVGPNIVQSKWGDTDEIIEHSIGSVPKLYRYSYILLRKDGATLDTPWIR
jgi:hypothetical protein